MRSIQPFTYLGLENNGTRFVYEATVDGGDRWKSCKENCEKILNVIWRRRGWVRRATMKINK